MDQYTTEANSARSRGRWRWLKIFAAGLFVGWLATSAYFMWKEYKCVELAMSDLSVTQAEAQRLFAGCYNSIFRFTSKKKWELEMKERVK